MATMARTMSPGAMAEPRAKRTRAASDKFGRIGTRRSYVLIEPRESSTESTVDKLAEIAAPAYIIKKKVGRNFSARLGTICSVSSRPGNTDGPTRPMYTGTIPTRR